MDFDFKTMMESLPAFVICTNPRDEKILWANSQAASILGAKENENISTIFSNDSDYNKFKKKYAADIGKKQFIHRIKDSWYAVASSYHGEDCILVFTGVDVNEMVLDGYVEAYKSKDEVLGIYDRRSAVEFLDGLLLRLKDDDAQGFTLTYLRLDSRGLAQGDETKRHMVQFAQVVSNGIRDTDTFAYMGDMEFVVMFPRCTFEVVENILTTIENKLRLLSASEGLDCDFNFDHAILELGPGNTADSRAVMEKARNMLL